MRYLTPYTTPALKTFFDDDFFPDFGDMSVKFPKVDIVDKNKNIEIRADIPGLNKDNLKIEADEDVVYLQGEVKDEQKEEKENYYRRERRVGGFYREIVLPCCVDPNKIKAKFKEGCLTLTLPKTEDVKRKKVEVEL